jgi:hypothetical protein
MKVKAAQIPVATRFLTFNGNFYNSWLIYVITNYLLLKHTHTHTHTHTHIYIYIYIYMPIYGIENIRKFSLKNV